MLTVKNKITVSHIGFKYFNRLQNKLSMYNYAQLLCYLIIIFTKIFFR